MEEKRYTVLLMCAIRDQSVVSQRWPVWRGKGLQASRLPDEAEGKQGEKAKKANGAPRKI